MRQHVSSAGLADTQARGHAMRMQMQPGILFDMEFITFAYHCHEPRGVAATALCM